jgi:hypothetical protein
MPRPQVFAAEHGIPRGLNITADTTSGVYPKSVAISAGNPVGALNAKLVEPICTCGSVAWIEPSSLVSTYMNPPLATFEYFTLRNMLSLMAIIRDCCMSPEALLTAPRSRTSAIVVMILGMAIAVITIRIPTTTINSTNEKPLAAR